MNWENIDSISHPAAKLFPMMTEAKLKELAEDIKKNGQLEPISLHGDIILDGRNRAAACKMLGIDPESEQVETDSPVQFIISKNLQRRDLTKSQRTLIVLTMLPMLKEEAKQRQAQTQFGDKSNEMRSPSHDRKVGEAIEIAAQAADVSPSMVGRAAAVEKHAPELLQKVESGEATVNEVYDEMRESQRKKKEPTARDAKRDNAFKNRMMGAFGAVQGGIRGLTQVLDIARISSVCTADEAKWLVKTARELANSLKAFAKKLEEEGGKESGK